jgi:hypothetical protein
MGYNHTIGIDGSMDIEYALSASGLFPKNKACKQIPMGGQLVLIPLSFWPARPM